VSDGSIQIFPTGAQGFRSASVGLVLPPSAQCHFDNHWSYASKPKTSIKGAHPPGETVSFFFNSLVGMHRLTCFVHR
jgi:hypothetical protein